ncbi:MAG TPA: hypothetical protein PKB09_01230 [Candidatus Saccharibacteria bacterium]|nr:hypothetical protein [Candidatus Saccharibacteria bacterium]
MSIEQYKKHEGSGEKHEVDKDLLHERDKKIEKIIEKGENYDDSKTEKAMERLRENVEDTAKSKSEKLNSNMDDSQASAPAPRYDRNVKKAAYKKELQRARKHMNTRQKAFSKVVHNPVVESISEVGAKTAARPSGLLGGGIFASAGTLILYIMSRYYGFEYNFFVFILLLISGFLIGICVELIVYPILKKQ